LPLRGELVPGPAGFELEVIDADPHRLKKIKIHRSKDRPARGLSQPNARGSTVMPAPAAALGADTRTHLAADPAPPKNPPRP
jgi:hypothetical protein